MDASELANYEFQLQQVEASLAKDPTNAELKKLAGDLSELITITRSLLPSAPTPAAAPPAAKPPRASKPTGAARPPPSREPLPPSNIFTEHAVLPPGETVDEPVFPSDFSVNDKVQAKWSRDNAWYPATIQSISGGTTAATKIYSVRFVGYDTVDLVKADKIRWPQSVKKQSSSMINAPAATSPPSTPSGAPPTTTEEESSAPGGKLKTRRPGKATLEEHKAKKAAELNSKTSNWRNFASKSKAAINNKSIFRTPEGNTGRVGVVGSGQPMTESQRQGRWK